MRSGGRGIFATRIFRLSRCPAGRSIPWSGGCACLRSNIDITCRPLLRNQKLSNYWEGAVDYSGSQTGVGYLEMTGYDGPVRF